WQFEHAEVTSLLLNALQDPDEHVRRSAVLGLCGMETTRRMNRLYRLLNAHNELDEEHYEQIMLTLKTFQHYRYLQSQLNALNKEVLKSKQARDASPAQRRLRAAHPLLSKVRKW